MNAPLAPGPRAESLHWLVACCRCWLGGPSPERPPDDWADAGRMAFLHQLEPLLDALAEGGRIDVAGAPERLRRRWQETLYRNYIFNAELLELGSAIVAGCRERGLPVALFKGPVTAARGYGALELRIMADLDLLCREGDLRSVAELARGLGFEPAEQTADYHLGFLHRGLGAGLELHFELYERIAGREALLAEILAQPHAVEIDERTLPAPAPEAAAILDLAHLAHHDYRVPLRSLLDLAAVLGSGADPPSPTGITELARRTGLRSELGRLLALFDGPFGWPLPQGFAALAETAAGEPFAERLLDLLRRPAARERRPLLAGPHVRPGAAATGRYLLRRLFPPPRRLQALYGSRSAATALLHLPRHLAVTLRRGLTRWRSGGLVDSGLPDRRRR